MDWENRSHNVVPASPWSDGMEVGMPSGWLSQPESQDAGIGANANRFQVGSGFDSRDGNRSDFLDTLSTNLDRQLCGNITDGYLQVTSKATAITETKIETQVKPIIHYPYKLQNKTTLWYYKLHITSSIPYLWSHSLGQVLCRACDQRYGKEEVEDL